MTKIKVLIVDDSAVMRQLLKEILSSDPSIEVVATLSIRSRPVKRFRDCSPMCSRWTWKCPAWMGSLFSKSSCGLIPCQW